MDYTVLEKSPLFAGIPAVELRELLETTPHHIQCYDKGETIFHLMDPATQIGIILEGRLLAVDPGKENREEQSAYSRICFQMGNAYECLPSITSQGTEKTGRSRDHNLCPAYDYN